MTYVGKMRLHFNRHGAAPLVWCVATDDWELAVASFSCSARLVTVYRHKAVSDEDDGKPSAWLETTGRLVLEGSHARIEAAP